MTFTRARIYWAGKLLKARYFVLLTDKESVIAMDGVNPNEFKDAIALTSQAAELQLFHDKLGGLIVEHDAAIAKLRGDDSATRPATNRTRKKRATKESINTTKNRTTVRANARKTAKN